MRALKVAVVVMGLMIVAGVTVIAVTIAKRAGMGTAEGESSAAREIDGFGDASISLPPGATVVDELVSAEHLVLKIRLGDGEIGYMVVDLLTGRTRGTLRAVEAR